MKKLTEGFTKEYMARLEAFSIKLNEKMSNVSQSGIRKSGAKGNSLEFSDFREYIAGDDIRRIDWNGYARFDRIFVKLFMEEKQADINLFIDKSNSMGEHEDKLYYAKMLAASIGYISLKNTDRVNMMLFNSQVTDEKTKLVSKNSFFEIVNFLDNIDSNGQTDINNSIMKNISKLSNRGICFIFSDFFSLNGFIEAIKMLRYKKQDVVLVQILSGEERSPLLNGNIRIIDSETGENIDMEVTEGILNEYKKALVSYENELKDFCKQYNMSFVSIDTSQPIIKGLMAIL